HGLVHVLRVDVLEVRSVLAVRQGATLTGEVVALRAVGAEQFAALGDVGALGAVLLLRRDGGTGTQRGDVGGQLVDLGLAVPRRLARRLSALRGGGRHAAGGHVEVHGRGAHAHQARRVGGPLTAGAVAAGAADRVELLSLLDGEGLGGFFG